MKKLFRWFALSLLVGAMAFAVPSGSAGANEDDDRGSPCGYVQNGANSIPLGQHCTPANCDGVSVTVTVGAIRSHVCSG